MTDKRSIEISFFFQHGTESHSIVKVEADLAVAVEALPVAVADLELPVVVADLELLVGEVRPEDVALPEEAVVVR